MTRIVCISDTHQCHDDITERLPEADVLLFAGDMCNAGTLYEVELFSNWISKVEDRYNHVIVVAGNHDWPFQKEVRLARAHLATTKAIYLENQEVVIDGIKFYGTPASREFCCWAFNYTNDQLKKLYDNIPDDVNVLITHSMPINILDYAPADNYHAGCTVLPQYISYYKDLKLYVGGHLHYEGGLSEIHNNVTYINASVCDEDYEPVQGPVIITI